MIGKNIKYNYVINFSFYFNHHLILFCPFKYYNGVILKKILIMEKNQFLLFYFSKIIKIYFWYEILVNIQNNNKKIKIILFKVMNQ